MAMSETQPNAELYSPVLNFNPPAEDVEFEITPLPADTVMRVNDARCGCCQCVVGCVTCVVPPKGGD